MTKPRIKLSKNTTENASLFLQRRNSDMQPPVSITISKFESAEDNKAIKLQTSKSQLKTEDMMEQRLCDQIKDLQEKTLVGAVATKKQMFAIYHLIINQTVFRYDMRDLLSSFARCFTFRSNKSLKNYGKRKEFYLRKGQEKLERDLDIVNLLNLIKGYRQMR